MLGENVNDLTDTLTEAPSSEETKVKLYLP